MYAYIKGILIQSTPSTVILEAQGIGYCLCIPFNNFSKLPPFGQPLLLYTTYVVREDSQKLYGFLTVDEKELFEELIDVSGVGPKTALGLVGNMDIYDLQTAIQQGQIPLICKIPGIGKKTAERLVVELRDKMQKKSGRSSLLQPSKGEMVSGVVEDATSALLNLGYNSAQIQKAIKQVMSRAADEEPGLAALITSVLRVI